MGFELRQAGLDSVCLTIYYQHSSFVTKLVSENAPQITCHMNSLAFLITQRQKEVEGRGEDPSLLWSLVFKPLLSPLQTI